MKPTLPFLTLTYLSVFLSCAGRCFAVEVAAAKRPNVIIVLSDDQGYGDFSCLGNPVLKTPNLDKLHDQSIRLTDFHVAPMCSPTRGQLLTGLDALHNGVTSVCAGRACIRRGIPTMAEMFAANGYRTGQFGKWHLGDSYPNLPQQRGFQESLYFLGYGITSLACRWNNDNFDGHFHHNGVLHQYKGYCTDVWFEQAMAWMKQCRQKREPFFVYLPTNAAHSPHWVADKYKQPYKGRGPAAFFGMLANLDENMGRLDAFLNDSGLRDNTLIIFFNDNGGTAGVRLFNAGMRGHKTQYYEGGHRAACFLRWPAGQLRRPTDVGNLTQVQDLLPTLIELCGLKTPAETKFDGVSLAPLLRGQTDALADRMLVVQYGQPPKKGMAAVMWKKWRLVHNEELYNLQNDPGQKKNVAAEHPDLVAKMRAHYEKWWTRAAKKLNDFTPIRLGSEQENPLRLSAVDWADVYCDNASDVRKGVKRNGPWHVQIERDGTYEIALRRWPKEADAAISAGVPAFRAVDGVVPAGKALPIIKARLKIGNIDISRPVAAADKEAAFVVKLKGGTRTRMQTWFFDADNKELCGAYYAYVHRK